MADSFYIYISLSVAPYSCLICISPERQRGNSDKTRAQRLLTSPLVQQLTKDSFRRRSGPAVQRANQMGALLPRRTAEGGSGEGEGRERGESRSLHGPQGSFRPFFFVDRTAERGITLPNEQAHSRGVSFRPGRIVAAAACSAQSVFSLGTRSSVLT